MSVMTTDAENSVLRMSVRTAYRTSRLASCNHGHVQASRTCVFDQCGLPKSFFAAIRACSAVSPDATCSAASCAR